MTITRVASIVNTGNGYPTESAVLMATAASSRATLAINGLRLREEPLPNGVLPATIMDLPSVWLKRSESEMKNYPDLPLLAQPHDGPSKQALRCFLVAEIIADKKTKNVLWLGSFGADSNVCHMMLSLEILEDVAKIDPNCTVESLRGGFIEANHEEKMIKVSSKYGAYPPADLDLTAELLKDGLGAEYHGFKVHLKLDGEFKFERKTVID